MTNEKFRQLVSRLEQEAERYPQRHKAKVIILAALGYLYILVMLMLLLALAGAAIYYLKSGQMHVLAAKLLIPLSILLYFTVKSLWVKIPAPSHERITKRNAPELMEEVERMSEQLKGIRVHEIQINQEFNASVVQIPRLGIFGWHKNILILGLPLMLSLSKEQFRAVLAHELGHLSGSHGRFNAWIYRIRRTWGYLHEQLEQSNSRGQFLFLGFSRRFAPYFNAYTFVFARANEYDADRCAADIAGKANTAAALQLIHIRNGMLADRFWSQLERHAVHESDPPNAYSLMSGFLADSIQDNDHQFYIRQALLHRTDYLDTHPSLNDRLRALEAEAALEPFEPAPAAADVYLHEVGLLLQRFDKSWKEGARTEWRGKYEQYRKLHQLREELTAAVNTRELTMEERFQLADAVEELESQELALPMYQDLIRLQPDFAPAHFAAGRILTSLNRPEGVDHLTYCMKLEERSISPSCHHLYAYFLKHGDQDRALGCIRHSSEWNELQRLRHEELSQLHVTDTLLNEQPQPEVLQALAVQAALHKQIEQAYIVKKQTAYVTETSIFIMIIQFKAMPQYDKEEILRGLAHSAPTEHEFFFIDIHTLTGMKTKLKKIKASPFYIQGKSKHAAGASRGL